MASFLSYLVDREKALEDEIKALTAQLPASEEPDRLRAKIRKLEAQLEELKKRRTW